MKAHFIEPLDVLFLRGNRLFGEAGSYGESTIPPWPSAIAGALRSAILVRDDLNLTAFARGEIPHPALGTPQAPGTFRVTWFHLAWRGATADDPVEPLYPLPADLVATRSGEEPIRLHPIEPGPPETGIQSSCPTRLLPVLAQTGRAKPAAGLWLTAAGMKAWMEGHLPSADRHLVPAGRLWSIDERVGIALDATRGRADEGKLFTTQAAVPAEGVGFVARVQGDSLDGIDVIRLGGDGRAARIHPIELDLPQADLETIRATGRARLILTSPGLFPDGWRLPGMDSGGRWRLHGLSGRVLCAAVPRAEVISGWDLARWRPKPARRAAPAGSVYWIDELEADIEDLRRLADHGLWPDTGYDAQRRAEGFNRFAWGSW